jgi:hypothetical protein
MTGARHSPLKTIRFAAIDLGSLTVRLAVAEPGAPGQFHLLLHLREITGLGRGLAQTGGLAPEGMARTLQALAGFKQALADYQVENCRVVATHAVRAAKNGPAFLERLREGLGLEVLVLAPEQEARLSLQGVLSALAPPYLGTPVLVVDAGGGSCEFALARPGRESQFASLPLGVLTLSQAHPLGDPPDPEKVAALKRRLAQDLARFRDLTFPPARLRGVMLVGTAGELGPVAAIGRIIFVAVTEEPGKPGIKKGPTLPPLQSQNRSTATPLATSKPLPLSVTGIPLGTTTATLLVAKFGSMLVGSRGLPLMPVILGMPLPGAPCSRSPRALDCVKLWSVLTT